MGGGQSIFTVAENGNVNGVIRFLDEGLDINAKDGNGRTVLHYACTSQKPEMVKVLLARGADINSPSNNGMSVLTIMITLIMLGGEENIQNKKEILQLLLSDKSLDVNRKDHSDKTALGRACDLAILKVKLLLKEFKGAVDLDKLIDPIAVETIGTLLKHDKLDVNLPHQLKYMVLAASIGYESIVQLFLANDKVNLNWQDEGGNTVLHAALKSKSISIVIDILSKLTPTVVDMTTDSDGTQSMVLSRPTSTLNLNLQDENGATPLMLASYFGMTRIVDMMICLGADVNIRDKSKRHVLHYCIREDDIDKTDIVDLILQSDKNEINAQDNLGATLLMKASGNNHIAVVKKLLDHRAAINLQTNNGATALHLAAANNNYEVISLLLEGGADMNLSDHKGGTPLLIANMFEHKEAIATLKIHQNLRKSNTTGEIPVANPA